MVITHYTQEKKTFYRYTIYVHVLRKKSGFTHIKLGIVATSEECV